MGLFGKRVVIGALVVAGLAGVFFARHYVIATPAAALSLVGQQDIHFGHTVMQQGRPSGTRIYLFHGLRSDRSYWFDAPYSAFTEARLEAGDELILVDLPYTEAGLFADGGAAYCRAFTDWLRDLDASLPPKRTFAVGTSWGGLHASIASATVSSIAGYVEISPIVRIDRLPEFWMVSNDRCTQSLYADRMKPGLVLYGDADERAGSDLIAASVTETHAESVVYHGLGHETTTATLERAGEWIDRR